MTNPNLINNAAGVTFPWSIGVSGRADHASEAAMPAGLDLKYVDGLKWDRFAAGYDDVICEQTNCFIESRWGAGRSECVQVFKDGEVIGGAAVVLFRFAGPRLAILKWGPLWRETGARIDITRLRMTLAAIKAEFVDRRGCYLSVMPQADPEFGEATVKILRSLGFTKGSSCPFPDRYLVNTSISSDELMAKLDQKWRYNLRKSLKNNLKIEIVPMAEGYPEFIKLYHAMLDRKQFQDSSAIHTLPDLIESRAEAHQPVFVIVRHEGKVTAGAVLDISGERAVYLYGATDSRALPLKAGYAMHWWIAEWLCDLPQIRWYDLAGSDGEKGLHQFKKSFVGKAGAVIATPPAYNCGRTIIDMFIGKSVFLARDIKSASSRTLHRIKLLIAA